MTIFGFSKKQRRALHAGEVVTMDLKRIGNEVVALVALRMPLSLKEVEQTYIGPGAFKSGGNILAFGQPDLDGSSSWQEARFDAADKAELDEILNVEPGLDLNLSGPEIAALQERVGSLDSADPTGAISEA